MKIMVFGGAGFIGNHLCRALDDYEVISADNRSVRPGRELPMEIDKCEVDVKSPSQIRTTLEEHKPEVIYWFPAKQGYKADYANYARSNVVGVYALFEAIDRIKGYKPDKMILASSQAVYSPGELREEVDTPGPTSVYGLTKWQQETAFLWFCRERQIKWTALRYSIVLGSWQSTDSQESGILRNWYKAWKNNKAPQIYGDGRQMRDFIHVSDVTEANVKALTDLDGIYNVSGVNRNVLGVFDDFRSLTDCKSAKVLKKSVRPGGEFTLTSNGVKIQKHCGWFPKTPIKIQIKDFLDAAQSS